MTFQQKCCLLILKAGILVLQKETHMLQALQPQSDFKKALFVVPRWQWYNARGGLFAFPLVMIQFTWLVFSYGTAAVCYVVGQSSFRLYTWIKMYISCD